MAAEASRQRGLCRALLRECRRLGPAWVPSPPATDKLWGLGFQADAAAPSLLLQRLAPRCLRAGLTGAAQQRPFAPWLRATLRRGLAWHGGPGAGVAPLLQGGEEAGAEALDFLQQQATVKACTSSSEEGGLRVDAVSGFVGGKSDAAKGQYIFAYNMRFTNTGTRRLRVLARQYDFRDASGALSTQMKPEQPEAAGVVGYTPLLEPGASFEFGSGVPMRTPRGSVTGRFLVMVEPELSEEDAEVHRKMENAELMLRFVYLKGLGTEQFHVPVGQLRFDADVPCTAARMIAPRRPAASGSPPA